MKHMDKKSINFEITIAVLAATSTESTSLPKTSGEHSEALSSSLPTLSREAI